ncbi:glucose-methanol-choline oxidoreductase, partial [Infundibulicybe gibba]
HHACCTNPMGADNDKNAVLDGNFRVRGVANLRVVDASSWPTVPGYFVTTPIYMISEKAADVII